MSQLGLALGTRSASLTRHRIIVSESQHFWSWCVNGSPDSQAGSLLIVARCGILNECHSDARSNPMCCVASGSGSLHLHLHLHVE